MLHAWCRLVTAWCRLVPPPWDRGPECAIDGTFGVGPPTRLALALQRGGPSRLVPTGASSAHVL